MRFESVARLWSGSLPLARAFWEHAILYGGISSLVATAGALAVLALDLPALLALAVHLSPVPYLLATVVGVYRSAGHYRGAPVWARAAETAAVLWAGLMVFV